MCVYSWRDKHHRLIINEPPHLSPWPPTLSIIVKAPEVMSGGPYESSVDLYSTGIMMARLLIDEGKVNASSLSNFRALHSRRPSVDLFQRFMSRSPRKRGTAEQALDHGIMGAISSVLPLPRLRVSRSTPRKARVFA